MAAHVAFHLGEYAFAKRQGQLALKKANEGPGEDDLVAIVAISMKNLENGPETISGLYSYGAENLNRKFKWMKGLICLAKKKYEEGITLIQNHLQGTNGLCKQLLIREILVAHFSLCDFNNYVKWQHDYKESGNSTPQDTIQNHPGYENSLRLLCSFDQGSINKSFSNSNENEKIEIQLKNTEDAIIYVQHQLLQNANRYVKSYDDKMSRYVYTV